MRQIHMDTNYNISFERIFEQARDIFLLYNTKDNSGLPASFSYKYALLGGGIQQDCRVQTCLVRK